MSLQPVHDPTAFLVEFQGLHDVCVDRIEFDAFKDILTLFLEDLHAIATGVSKHKNARPCALVFHGATSVLIDVETSEGIRIGDVTVEEKGTGFRFKVDLNLGGGDLTRGRGSITAAFASLHISDP